jgi:plasmid stabilization system protein ParE
MRVNFSKDSKEFLFKTKDFIAQDNPTAAKRYTTKLINRIVDMLQFPNIGKVNATFDDNSIREITLDGMKIIYKIYPNSVAVLMIYRYIDFDESTLENQ